MLTLDISIKMEYLLVRVATVCGEATDNYGLFTNQQAYEKGLNQLRSVIV